MRAKGHLARSCTYRGRTFRGTSVHVVNLLGEPAIESLVPISGTFVEEAEETGHKIATIGTKTIGGVSEKNVLHVVGFLGVCKTI